MSDYTIHDWTKKNTSNKEKKPKKTKKPRKKNLYQAAENGDLQRVQELLTVRNINKLYVSHSWYNEKFSKGKEFYRSGKETALYRALADGRNNVAALLLQNGAKLIPAEYNIDPNGNPPFAVEVHFRYDFQYYQQPKSYYVHEGSSVHPLCIAVRVGNYEGAKLVLAKYPNLDQKILDNALFHAVVRCPSSFGTLLVERGANPNAMYAGRTPLIELCREYFIYGANAQEREAHRAQIIPWIRLLVSSGADINLVDTDGHSALFHLCRTRKQLDYSERRQKDFYRIHEDLEMMNTYLDSTVPADAITELLNHNAEITDNLMLTWSETIKTILRQEKRKRKKRDRHIARLVINRTLHTMGWGPGVARPVGDNVVKKVALFKQFTNLHL